eukprot:1175721-Lingulodinium_polyedra.AAC.1
MTSRYRQTLAGYARQYYAGPQQKRSSRDLQRQLKTAHNSLSTPATKHNYNIAREKTDERTLLKNFAE